MNALQLEKHKGRGKKNYDTNCRLCGEGIEDLAHFVVICKKLEEDRDYSLLDKEIVDPEVRLRVLLYRNKETVKVSKLIRNLWIHRRDLLRKQAKALRTI